MNNPQSILILGYGREGRASLPYLKQRHPEARIGVADQNACEERGGTEWLCGDNYPTELSEWEMVVVSPGITPSDPLLATAQHITTATNIFFEDCTGTIIGVTGSKGKSTTASLIAHILNAELVGNIGAPALGILLKQNDEKTVYVYELSSYQTRLLKTGPDVAVITSLFPEHLDYHGSLEQYYTDKLNITMQQTGQQHVFYATTQPELLERMQRSPATKHPWPSEEGVHIAEGIIYLPSGDEVMAVREISLLGAHNVSNVLGAVSVATHMGAQRESIALKVASFQPLPHRLQQVGTYHDITFYDDSISTTPESTIAALNALPTVETIFLGGTDRGYDFAELAQHIATSGVLNVVLFPDSGARIKEALESAGAKTRFLETRDMKEAVAFAYEHTGGGKIALLSCAAPSYSLYKNFEERGKYFQAEIAQQA